MADTMDLKRNLPIAVGIILSVLSIIWIVKNFNLAEVISSFLSADFRWFIPVIILILGNYALRAVRWGLLFSGSKIPSGISLYTSLMIGYLANNILPARIGEFVRAFVLKTREGISKSSGLATIVVERTSDLMVALLLLSLILLMYPFPEWLQTAGVLVSFVTLAAFTCILMLNFYGEWVISWFTKRMFFLPKKWLNSLDRIGHEFVFGLTGLKRNHRILPFITLTFIIWMTELGFMLCMAWAFYLPVTIMGMLFIMVVTGLSTIIPSSPGYIGTYEFFTMAAFALVGITGNTALSFTIATHALIILFSSVIGAACAVYTGIKISSFSKPDF